MRTQRERVRSLPTEVLVERLVLLLVDVMQEPQRQPEVTPAMDRLVRELKRRDVTGIQHHPDCVCSDCFDPIRDALEELLQDCPFD